jgi:hypothetical protein
VRIVIVMIACSPLKNFLAHASLCLAGGFIGDEDVSTAVVVNVRLQSCRRYVLERNFGHLMERFIKVFLR